MPQAPASASIFSVVSEVATPVVARRKPSATKKPKIDLSTDASNPRRGSRTSTRARKPVTRFADDTFSDNGDDSDVASEFSDASEGEDGETRSSKKRKSRTAAPPRLSGYRPNPKHFGDQPGTQVGKWWRTRMECSQDGIHAPTVAGISGNSEEGTWSVALSGGYAEDIDFGYSFSYTGCGGRDLKGTAAQPKNLRTAPQTFDQTFTALNAALKRSVETAQPVRVVRGFKNPSPFAPKEGYSYSGLYLVTKAWLDVGDAGFKVTRFSFVRMAGQAPLPIQPGREDEAAEIIAVSTLLHMGFTAMTLTCCPFTALREDA